MKTLLITDYSEELEKNITEILEHEGLNVNCNFMQINAYPIKKVNFEKLEIMFTDLEILCNLNFITT